MVRAGRLELPRGYHWNLNPARLPISPRSQSKRIANYNWAITQTQLNNPMSLFLKALNEASRGLLLLSITPIAIAQSTMNLGSVVLANDVKINVEIAANGEQRRSGLMYRNTLPPDRGMLFVYPYSDYWGVWMKNTQIALDVIFLSEQGKVVEIIRNLQPCHLDPCPIFRTKNKARYMLEIYAGLADTYSIQPTQELLLDYQH
ncbi:MAG: hypothetical protein RL563_1515 [Pseudomonadota bacterium]